MIILEDRLIFVHIQKTGGTAINRALGTEDHPKEKHRTASELKSLYGATAWDESYKFAFVRNPWDRLVSWWSMIDGQRAHIENTGQANIFFKYVLENATTFEEFICNCQNEINDTDGIKCIFRNQIDYLTDDNEKMIVDFIGRFENLSTDFATVTTKIYGTPKNLPIVNSSHHAAYQSYYTHHTQQLVADAYARDIKAFGYTFAS